MNITTKLAVGLLGVLAPGMWMGAADAAVVSANNSSYGSQTAFAASSTDLINAGQPTLVGVSGVYNVNFGSANAFNDGTASGGACCTDVGNTIGATFTLACTPSIPGYNISSIVTLAGWDDARANQDIQISYHVYGEDPGTFHTLGTYNNSDATGGNYSTKITVYDSLGGYIMSGVDKISFAALNTHGYGTMVTEWDVFGTAVPEPASLGLLLLGGLALLRRRW